MRLKILIITILCTASISFTSDTINVLHGEENSIQGLNLPKVKKLVIDSDLSAYYIKEDMPVLDLVVRIGYGSLYEDSLNAGTAQLLSKVLSEGGSADFPGKKLYEQLEAVGGSFSVGSSYEGVYISIRVLERHADLAFQIVSSIIKRPNFSEENFKSARALVVDSLKRRDDDPTTVALDTFKEILYQKKGYGAIARVDKVAKYSTKDIQRAWKKYSGSRNMMIGVATSLSEKMLSGYFKKYFSGISSGTEHTYKAPLVSISKDDNTIYFIERKLPQSTIIIGTGAPSITYGDTPALKMLNYVLGGGSFNSRLMREIRVKRGYAYVVQSIMRFRKSTGLFLSLALTGNKNVNSVLDIMRKEIRRMEQEKISPKELGWARDAMVNSYIFKFNTPESVLRDVMSREFYGLGETYHSNFLNKIKLTKAEKIRTEAVKLLKNGLFTVVLGPKEVSNELKKRYKVINLKKNEN